MVMMARAASVVVVLLLVALGLCDVVRRVLVHVSLGAPARADELLVGVLAALALAVTAWLAAGVLAVALTSVPGRVGRVAARLAGALTPLAVRRVVGVVVGVTVTAGITPGASVAVPGPASAVVVLNRPDPGFAPFPDPGWTVGTTAGVGGGPDDVPPDMEATPDPGWVPAPPVVRPQPDLRVLAPSRHDGAADDTPEVVVRRGDTLWSIAAHHLGPDPSEAEVARAWPAWYAANREVVGDDPDLLRPGQVLRAPEGVVS